jgi:hypothetical protein
MKGGLGMPTVMSIKQFSLTQELIERLAQEHRRRSALERCSEAQLVREILDKALPPLKSNRQMSASSDGA